MGALNVELWSVAVQRALAFRDAVGDYRFYDIGFRPMQQDPIGVVRGLYDWLGRPVTEEFEHGMERWWRENAERRESNVHSDPADLGIDPDRVRPLFADYTTRMARFIAR